MRSRREFFVATFAALATGPLVKAGLLKAPAPDVGITIRMTRTIDPATGTAINRIVAIYGVGAVRPEYSCRIVG